MSSVYQIQQARDAVDSAPSADVAAALAHRPRERAFPPLGNEFQGDSFAPAAERHSQWPTLRDIESDLPPAPAFDAHALLPHALAEFVLDEADRMCAAPDYVAATLIVAIGAVIGTRCAIKPKRRDDWIVTPNLYGGVVGDPSAKKTPTTGTVMRFLDRLEAEEVKLLADRKKTHEAELAAFEAHEAAIKASMKKAASGKPDAGKMLAAQSDLEKLEKLEEPRPRRFKSNDATIEKLGDILSHN